MEYVVEVIYKRIRNMHLRVKDGKVIITCPFLTSKKQIDDFVIRCKPYIEKQITIQERNKQKRLLSIGDKINILGNDYEILLTNGTSKKTDHFIFVNDNEDIRKQVKILFKDELLNIMLELTRTFYEKMGIIKPVPNVIIKDVKTLWGSYNKRSNKIEYANELIFKDIKCFDYLVVHELSHMIEFNHSKNFYNLVSNYLPNYKELRKVLKEK